MATYLILNIIVVGVLLAIMSARRILHWNRRMSVVLVILLVLTAIFDSVIVASGIVQYNEALILGIRIGAAPIEDFFYAGVAALLVPALWRALGGKENV